MNQWDDLKSNKMNFRADTGKARGESGKSQAQWPNGSNWPGRMGLQGGDKAAGEHEPIQR